VDTIPATYFVGDNDSRMRLTGDELLKLDKFRVKCLEHHNKMPTRVSQKDWIIIVQDLIAEAGTIEPSKLYRKHVEQLESLEKYFAAHVPHMVRSKGEEYLVGKIGDHVRVRVKDERFYFKWDKLKFWCERSFSMRHKELGDMRAYVDAEATFHDRTTMRGWFRSSWSLGFHEFDEDMVYRWLHPDELEKESDNDVG
jgi:hypothetical protein